MRVALVHDWLTGMRGGERVLEALLGLFPDAEIFTLVHIPGSVSPGIEARPIHVSPLGRIPALARCYRFALPLMPAAVEAFDLSGFDLVVSSSHCVAKGARAPAGVPHLCYCHAPMRYVWDRYDDYFGPGRAAPPVRAAMALAAPRLRAWDRRTAGRPTTFIANSAAVGARIGRFYGRDAAVVHPPVDIDRFAPAAEREDFYLVLGALVPYKRVDLVIDGFNRLGRPLLVAGDGPEMRRLRARAGANVTLTGRLSDTEVASLLGRCRALVHAGVEDFGIALVEAQAAGAPVIAHAAGGALESVIDAANPSTATGILFPDQTVEGLVSAVRRFEASRFDRTALRRNAERFTPERFDDGIRAVLAGLGISP